MAFQYPGIIRKDTKLDELDNNTLKYWHEKMHVFWNQIELGTEIPEWSFEDVYLYHSDIVKIMKTKKIRHLEPINSLDVIKE